MKRSVYAIVLVSLLLWTYAITLFHIGVISPPRITSSSTSGSAQWIDRTEIGIHQLILTGTPYERGLRAGKITRSLMFAEEQELAEQFERVFPNMFLRHLFQLATMRWFWGIDRYLDPWMLEEMYGVAQSAAADWNYLADPFTRQVAYHGIHEVGQMMVDQGGDGRGCTVVALPWKNSWIIGRNFDFEGGRSFDTEKIMKWVFPDQGYAFVSVIWAGMVGAVTGINEHGVYLSINAAGSRDWRRYGMPSTLVLLKALQFSKSAEEAVSVLRSETMFITDLFVVADAHGKLYRVEKSPQHIEVMELKKASVITNHLISPRWKNDRINQFRRDELTSSMRKSRGEQRMALLEKTALKNPHQGVLELLRDKGEYEKKPLHLGNRRSIDPLIATHSVIYDVPSSLLYVSQGPGVSGPFLGFDLKASFLRKLPVISGRLERDPQVSDETFANVRASAKTISMAETFLKKNDCGEARVILDEAQALYSESYSYFFTRGDWKRCVGDLSGAKEDWNRSLQLRPAYPREIRALKARLGS